MHISALPANVFASAVSQPLNGSVARASSHTSSFESDLESGNIAGAQSFLSALQQKLSSNGSSATGSAIAAQIKQVSSDLSSGNINAAQADFSKLKLAVKQQAPSVSHSNNGAKNQGQALASSASSLTALGSYSALQQNAYANALNLSLPSSNSSFSVTT